MNVKQILLAIVGMLVGLLLFDTIPLHEKMICADYANTTECPEMSVWSQDYFIAREKFLAAAVDVGAEIVSHNVTTYGNTMLHMDEAFIFGSRKSLLVHISGVHGVEAFVNSPIQTHLLRTLNESKDQPSVLFIHGVNPYGFVTSRRFNENNVDLNRNDLTEEELSRAIAREPSVGFSDLDAVLNLNRAPHWIDRYLVAISFVMPILRHGYGAIRTMTHAGQYHDPEGFWFCGQTVQPSILILRSIMEKYRSFERVVVIDAHTGMGAKGTITLLASTPEDEMSARLVWGPKHVTATFGDSMLGHHTEGVLNYSRMLPNSNVLAITQETGTIPSFFVGPILVVEHAAYRHARGSAVHKVMRDWVRDAFAPQDIAFKRSALKNGEFVFWKAWEKLKEGW